ncbi:MAG: PstS family phosphate ABC transporter substrate-binding protein [Pseudomonadales bacterium]|jgi:phosphate transport system substrate-binding protein|nr:PstS family phosphate ABC transporter substrate-binding protein [Pseudomonadales bacterium]
MTRSVFSSLSSRMLRGAAVALSVLVAACGGGGSAPQGKAGEGVLSGVVRLDGSSTVFPISEAVAEEFLAVAPGVRVTVGTSGTGGGFKKFLGGETDINDASRPIQPEEIAQAEAKGIRYLQVSVAYDGISIVVNPANTWVDHLTVEELKRLWEPGSTVGSWSDIRAGWPNEPIRLYGPGTDSGTFDYFTEAINGKSGASRPDYTASEDDNVLVQGVAGDKNALGFFGFAYYEENAARLKLVPVDGGNGPLQPSAVTINDGTYSPLSRPIFIYLNVASMARAEVRAFVDFYLDVAPQVVSEVGYIPLKEAEYAAGKASVAALQP